MTSAKGQTDWDCANDDVVNEIEEMFALICRKRFATKDFVNGKSDYPTI